MPPYEELKVFSGNSNRALAATVCEYLGVPLGEMEVFKFSNDNTFVRIKENVRERDVFMIQSLGAPVNDSVMELLIMLDAARRASAGRVTAVIPYYGYGRTDKKDQPRVPITARLVADLLSVAGAERVLTLDLHAGQIQGFFSIPVDELTALPIITSYFKAKNLQRAVVVAVDIGISKKARDFDERLSVPLAIVEKRRVSGNQETTEQLNVIGDVDGRTAILMDDEVDTAGSVVGAAVALKNAGAEKVYACCTHGILSGKALARLEDSPIEELVVTDSVPLDAVKRNGKIEVISVSAILGEAIHRIHGGLSVGAMFDS
jgi:ribose-phosphate pyrophosphokinase